MKNFIILGLTALLLFAISAALSMWLNQGRYASENPSTEKSTKKGEKEAPEPKAKTETKPETGLGGVEPASLAALKDRENKLERRTDQVNLILRDALTERDNIDSLMRQVAAELKSAEGRVNDLDIKTAELEKKRIDFDTAERKNIERIASLMDSMSPESAASTLKQMADSGKLEVAAKVLVLMKDRNAARALGELSDPALAAQLLDKMRLLKAATPPTTPRPSGPVPASGVGTPTPKSPAP
jgi:hypothetical protein